jgi:transcriptional pleiotropic regulator of transition state genes
MTDTGIVREIDELGRIVIPKELRRSFKLPSGTPLHIKVDGKRIILEKSSGVCALCGSEENLIDFDDYSLCEACVAKIKEK